MMGRRPSGKEPTAAITEVTSRHREMMRRIIAGAEYKEISIAMGISGSRLSVIVNSSLFKAELAKMEETIAQYLIEHEADLKLDFARDARGAYTVQKDIMEDVTMPPSVRVDVANQILERAGHTRKVEDKGQGTVIVITNINRDGPARPKEIEAEVIDI